MKEERTMLTKLMSLSTNKIVIYTFLALFSLTILVALFGPDTVSGWFSWILSSNIDVPTPIDKQ